MPIDSELPGSRFPAHGHSEFRAEGAIVRISGEGPFNVEGIMAFGRRMLALYATLPEGQAIVTLAEIRRSLLAPPEAWDLFEAHTSRVQAGPRRILATAWIVAEDVEGRSLMLPRVRRMYAAVGRTFEVFTEAEAANRWAQAQLAKG